ncbi:hypothetical protein SDRG_08714 [Saprolegnia diclina VS20]|uniref:RRM domain-containing protein n=1 Tax=Saprolegnia diclina (strain VS20) TaxID=1156394 RepID=T0RMP6_SAPDV|nr:hypothetical protein SDRG_08714 [Saprolegnia diclina VS20]EQC33608.1 hypothetical protein SDRG_08714 [Saprolegnia diclina VS20]|eukprot:XP_008612831.1 hypothetical protein SDRG_08714 [Saprolegnia diclina VS20]
MEASKKRKLGSGEAADAPAQDDTKVLMRLLEPFSRDQLVAILVSAAMQHNSILTEIKTMASTDVVHRKIFVRGLPWDITSDRLRLHFVQFGPIEDAIVIMDKATGKSKGFGFVTFADMEAADHALQAQPHDIDGRKCPCNLAATHESLSSSRQRAEASYQKAPPPAAYTPPPATTYPPPVPTHAPALASGDAGPPGDETDRKLFVRGLHWDTQVETVTTEFAKYGDIEDISVMKDRQTGKSKGYGFIVYRHQNAAKRALAQPMKLIEGRNTHCNLASQPTRGNNNHSAPGAGHHHAPSHAHHPPGPYHAPPMQPAYPPQMYMVPPSYGMPPPPYADPAAYAAYPQPPPMPGYGYPMQHPPPPRQ